MGNPVVHFEIIGTDAKALQGFYRELFGWHVEHNDEMNYGVVDTHAGTGIGGGIGVPQHGGPYTAFYIGVDDIDSTLARIEKQGGKTLMGKTVIPGVVTFAMFTDPVGNMTGLVWNDPSMPMPEPQPPTGNPEVGWVEVLANDADALAKFYTTIFGWTTKRNEMPGPGGKTIVYHEFNTGSPNGTQGGIGNSMDGKPRVTIYAGVDDVTKTLERAETLGGKIVMPESHVTEDTIIGQFSDPAGNVFGLYKRMPH